MSSFVPGIPNTNQSLLATRDIIKNNFSTIDNTISKDHVPMNNPNQGFHDKSTYVYQSSDPVTTSGMIAVYSKLVSSASQLFAIADGGSAYQLLGSLGTSSSTSGGCAIGGGFQIRWGQYNQNSTSVPVTFNVAFPNAVFGVLTTPLGGLPTTTVNILTQSVSGFTGAMNAGASHIVFYIALGN